jgi:hypothetical protein
MVQGTVAKNMGKKYALQFLAALVQVIAMEDLIPIAATIILPLFNLVELPDASETSGLCSVLLSYFLPLLIHIARS